MTDRRVRRSRVRCVIKPEDWPEADRLMWQHILTPADIFEPGGTGAHWAPATRAGVASGHGRWLKWLADHDRLDTAVAPVDRVTPELLAAYARDQRQSQASTSVVAHVAFLQMLLVAMAPERDWTWLRAFISGLKRNSTPKHDKQPKLHEPDELLGFGEELMAAAGSAVAAAGGITTWQNATDYRDGLMIALLALCPLRRRNFCAIRIGHELRPTSTGYVLAFEPSQTKNKRALAGAVPDALVAPLRRYLNVYRPFLCGLTGNRNPDFPFQLAGDFLWVSKTGSALSQQVFYKNLRNRTGDRFGAWVNPHAFRDCAATAVAIDMPEQVGIVPGLLGHANPTTAERYYIHAHSMEAFRRFQLHALKLRRAAEKAEKNAKAEKTDAKQKKAKGMKGLDDAKNDTTASKKDWRKRSATSTGKRQKDERGAPLPDPKQPTGSDSHHPGTSEE